MEERTEFKFKLKITEFVGDRLVSREAHLDTLEDALKQIGRESGYIKIYDYEGRVIHSENRQREEHEFENYA